MSEHSAPLFYPKCFEEPQQENNSGYHLTKVYEDGVSVSKVHRGDTVTTFPDGGKHRERPRPGELRYELPESQQLEVKWSTGEYMGEPGSILLINDEPFLWVSGKQGYDFILDSMLTYEEIVFRLQEFSTLPSAEV